MLTDLMLFSLSSNWLVSSFDLSFLVNFYLLSRLTSDLADKLTTKVPSVANRDEDGAHFLAHML